MGGIAPNFSFKGMFRSSTNSNIVLPSAGAKEPLAFLPIKFHLQNSHDILSNCLKNELFKSRHDHFLSDVSGCLGREVYGVENEFGFGQREQKVANDGRLAGSRGADKSHRQLIFQHFLQEVLLTHCVYRLDYYFRYLKYSIC